MAAHLQDRAVTTTRKPRAAVRDWLEAGEPYFRFIEVVIVAVVGVWIGYQQTMIAEKALEVSEAELEQARQQTNLSLREFAPDFRFHHKVDQTSSIGATDKANRVRALDGHAKYYIEFKNSKGVTKRILVDGFFENYDSKPKEIGEAINFYYNERLYQLGAFSMQQDVQFGSGETKKLLQDTDYSLEAYSFVELRFYNSANQDQIERYRLSYPCSAAIPLESEPKFDRIVKLDDFYDPQGKQDIPGLINHVRQLVTELKR
jgi:hypothetical protein